MRTILFFDDWLIQNSRGISRQWMKAEPWPGFEPIQGWLGHHASIINYRDKGRWRMWCFGPDSSGTSCVCLYESSDGLTWSPCIFDSPVDIRASSSFRNIVFSGNTAAGGACVFRDDWETDSSRRYKMVYTDTMAGKPDNEAYGQIAVSRDGIHWKLDPDAVWASAHVDTFPSTQFNPYTKNWQWMSRPISGDRRVALYQTSDWKHFSVPLIVLHPDPADIPGVEFYGMPHFFYEGYGVGFLWRMHSTYDERGTPHRMRGKVDAELTYSVNGVAWNRTNRQNFMPDRGFGAKSFRMEFPGCMLVDDDGWIRIYGCASVGEHNDSNKLEPGEVGMTVSRFRRDGFCALETDTDMGELTLRPLVSRGGEITLNAVTARLGSIRGELRSVPDDMPIPGYELENCVPVEGDGDFLQLQWKERKNIDQLIGQAFRIHLHMVKARLYAIRVEADYLFGVFIHRSLAGEVEPGAHPEFLKSNLHEDFPAPAL